MSSINPNNIDGAYPIAGQDNDSQGFRDNFTNIKNNLTFAQQELEDLQTYAILRAPLGTAGQTTTNNNLNNEILRSAQLIESVETPYNAGNINDPTTTIAWNQGHFQYFTLETSTTLTLSNWPSSGLYAKMRLQITPSSTANQIILPSAVTVGLHQLANANVITKTISFNSTDVHLYEFATWDSGATISIIPLIQKT